MKSVLGAFVPFKSVLLPVFLVVLTAYLNPANLTTASGDASQDIFFRFAAPFYGAEHQPITVIVLDDQYLKQQELSWPIPYRVTTKMLKALYCFEPKGIFIDLIYTHDHSRNDSELGRFIDYLKPDDETAGKIKKTCANYLDDEEFEQRELAKVFVGDQAPLKDYPVPNGSVVLNEMREGGVQRLPTNWVDDHGVYPLTLELDVCAYSERISLVGDGSCEDRTIYATGGDDARHAKIWDELWPGHVGGEILSPALTLYDVLDRSSGGIRDKLDDRQSQMVVSWGFYPRHLPGEAMTDGEHRDESRLRLRRFHADCNVRPERWYSPLVDSAGELVPDLFGRFDANPEKSSQVCPYSQWIPAEAVHLVRKDAQKETLRRLFKDRIVMIGADIRGAPDLMQSPVHGQIPGVFYHAMALDNLLEHGPANQWRPLPDTLSAAFGLPDVWLFEISTGAAIEVALVLVIFWSGIWINRLWGSRQGGLGKRLLPIVKFAVHLALIMIVVITIASMHYAPFNWLGLLGLIAITDLVGKVIFGADDDVNSSDETSSSESPTSANAKEAFSCSEPSVSH